PLSEHGGAADWRRTGKRFTLSPGERAGVRGKKAFEFPKLQRWLGVCLFICFAGIPLFGADLQKAQKDFLSGNYSNCIRVCEQAIRQNDFDEEWLLLLAQSLLTIGRYPDARSVVSNALPRYSTSVRLRLLGHEAFLHNGQTARARELIDEINELVGQRPWAYRDAPNLVAVGKAALL